MVSGQGSQPANAECRLQELGIELMPPPTSFGAYVEAVQTRNLLFLSGMLPAIGHGPKFAGRLGKELDANAGREAVRIAALNVLSAARQKLGSLDKVTRVVRWESTSQLMETSSINRKLPTLPPSYFAMSLEKTKPQSELCSLWPVSLWACPWNLKSLWKSRHKEAGRPASAFGGLLGETKLSMEQDARFKQTRN
jgi:enamine deaminase RidA (YjgF/YER057c/UK114 family)